MPALWGWGRGGGLRKKVVTQDPPPLLTEFPFLGLTKEYRRKLFGISPVSFSIFFCASPPRKKKGISLNKGGLGGGIRWVPPLSLSTCLLSGVNGQIPAEVHIHFTQPPPRQLQPTTPPPTGSRLPAGCRTAHRTYAATMQRNPRSPPNGRSHPLDNRRHFSKAPSAYLRRGACAGLCSTPLPLCRVDLHGVATSRVFGGQRLHFSIGPAMVVRKNRRRRGNTM